MNRTLTGNLDVSRRNGKSTVGRFAAPNIGRNDLYCDYAVNALCGLANVIGLQSFICGTIVFKAGASSMLH